MDANIKPELQVTKPISENKVEKKFEERTKKISIVHEVVDDNISSEEEKDFEGYEENREIENMKDINRNDIPYCSKVWYFIMTFVTNNVIDFKKGLSEMVKNKSLQPIKTEDLDQLFDTELKDLLGG